MLVEFVEVLAFRGRVVGWGVPLVDLSTPLDLVEAVGKVFEALAGVVVPEEFVGLEGTVGKGVF